MSYSDRASEAILEEALDVLPSEVPELLARRCGTDSELREEVERLLGVHARMASGFMGNPAHGWVLPRFEPGQKLGRYEIDSLIGAGGMSVVYRAQDPTIERFVAIKVLLPGSEESLAANRRFLTELRILGSIRHANVVQVFDYGELHGLLYIVMEYLEGEDLAKAIAGGRCGDFGWKLAMARQLAAALDHVHRAGVLHRDIKPANVFIEHSGRLKLMDFGIARPDGPGATHASILIGTPEYLPPEQVKGEPASRSSDIYAYGVLLFELFTGQKPYRGNTAELLYKIVHEKMPVEVLRKAALPKTLTNLIILATTKDPLDRPKSFGHICQDLSKPDLTNAVRGSAVTLLRRVAVVTVAAVACLGAGILLLDSRRAAITGGLERKTPAMDPAPRLAKNQRSEVAAREVAARQVAAGQDRQPEAPSSASPPPVQAKLPVNAEIGHPSLREPSPGTEIVAPKADTIDNVLHPPHEEPARPSLDRPPQDQTPQTRSGSGPDAPTGGPEPADTARVSRAETTLHSPPRPVIQPSIGGEGDLAKNSIRNARAAASASVVALLQKYTAAFSAKNLNEVGNLRNLTSADRRTIADMFSHSLKVEMTLIPVSETEFHEPVGDEGTGAAAEPRECALTADVAINLRTNDGEQPTVRKRVKIGFTRTVHGWIVSSWE